MYVGNVWGLFYMAIIIQWSHLRGDHLSEAYCFVGVGAPNIGPDTCSAELG